jgi:folate-binding Fe-S cluster repair protein YgfZ
LTAQPSLPPTGYEAAVSGAAYFHQAHNGYLRISGIDRQAFLQRQTTNDLRPETAQHGDRVTTPAARILDVLTLLEEPDAIGVITLPGSGGIQLAI